MNDDTQKKIRILYIVSTFKRVGPTNQLYGLMKNLDRKVFEPHVLTLSPEPSDSRYEEFVDLDISIHSLNLSRVDMMFKGKTQLIKAVEKIKPDLIHTSGIRADGYGQKNLQQYPQVNTIRNYAFEDYPVKFGSLKGNLMAKSHMNIISKIQHPVSCSKAIARVHQQKQGIETRVVQNGIDDTYYTPVSSQEKKQLRKMLKLPQNKKIFIFAGSLIQRKDPIALIKAFQDAGLSQKAAVVILGEGPLYDQCKQLKGESILLEGKVSNVLDYLRSGDVFVSSSHSEGLPNAVLEAMAVELPVILSDIEPHEEILERNEKTGTLYPLGNHPALVETLQQYVANPESMGNGKEAQKTVKQYFSAKVMSQSYQDLYREILKK